MTTEKLIAMPYCHVLSKFTSYYMEQILYFEVETDIVINKIVLVTLPSLIKCWKMDLK